LESAMIGQFVGTSNNAGLGMGVFLSRFMAEALM
jgi:hypothetical protein